MAEIITDRPSIGISACLFRCPVRYNGKAFDGLAVMGREQQDFVFTPVCPECLAGFGVPRMPIHLTGTGTEVLEGEAKVIDRRGHDRTADLVAGSHIALDAIRRAGVVAFIAKESSPSCGLYKTQVGKKRTQTKDSCGVFGALLLDSDLFLISDEALVNPLLWWDARRRLHAWLWLKNRHLGRAQDLYDAWHVIKFVVQETNRPWADAMGRRLAALPREVSLSELEGLRSEMLEALRTPSTRARVRGALWKAYSHARKSGQLDGVDLHDLSIESPEATANVMQLVEQLNKLERISFENDLLFGPSPVLHRDRRRVKAQRDATSDER